MIECLVFFLCIKLVSSDADESLSDAVLRERESLEMILWKLRQHNPRPGYGGDHGDLPLASVSLVKEFEGLAHRAYPDGRTGGKPYANGWGATEKADGSRWKLGERITTEQANSLLLKQLQTTYLSPLKTIPGWYQMKVYQQAALISFGYNCGAHFYGGKDFRTITNVLRYRKYSRKIVLRTFLLYHNPGTSVSKGLYRRRLAEAKLFLTGHAHTKMSLEI